MGTVAVGGILGLATATESKGLAGFRIDFIGGGLPAHKLIIEQSLENESSNCGRWKVESGRWKVESGKWKVEGGRREGVS